MKRFLTVFTVILSAAASALLLSSCSAVYRNYTPIENILVLQTMGIDTDRGGYAIALASGADADKGKPPVILSASGMSMTSALDNMGSASYEENLFFSHINHIIIGEELAVGGLDPILAYICRSPQIRIDTPVYLVKDGSACDAVTQCGTEQKGISEIMSALREKLTDSGRASVFTAAQIIRSIDRCGGCLICAVETVSGSEEDRGDREPGMAVRDCGYGIIRGGTLVGYISPEDAPGVGLLLGDTGVFELSVRDRDGNTVLLEVSDGDCEFSLVRDKNGRVRGVDISVTVRATVAETVERSGQLRHDAAYADYLTGRLEQSVSGKAARVLSASKRYKTDFLGLGSRLGLSGGSESSPEDFDQLLGEMNIRIKVSGEIIHSNDGRDS